MQFNNFFKLRTPCFFICLTDVKDTTLSSTTIFNCYFRQFGDLHSKAIDETWYKSAILQHQYDEESFVYSVPFDAGLDDDTLVTGSYAIFPSDAGMEAPGSVVGYQFSHKKLKEFVTKISTKTSVHFFEKNPFNQLKKVFFRINVPRAETVIQLWIVTLSIVPVT